MTIFFVYYSMIKRINVMLVEILIVLGGIMIVSFGIGVGIASITRRF